LYNFDQKLDLQRNYEPEEPTKKVNLNVKQVPEEIEKEEKVIPL